MKDDIGSFQEVYERYYPGILRFLTRLVGQDEAEDVAQEVFLKVDRGLKSFRGDAALGTWLYRISRNAALDHLRSRPRDESTREPPPPGLDEDPPDIGSRLPDERASIERYLIGKEMNDCIRRRVDVLPESHRSVLVLSELAGMTNAEIAAVLETSEGAVKTRLHRARAVLRKDLGARCTLYRDERDVLSCEPTSTLPEA